MMHNRVYMWLFSCAVLYSSILPTAFQQAISGYAPIHIDPTRVQMLGLSTERIEERKLTRKVRTVGLVDVDETRIAHIQTKFQGWIEELYVNFVGMPVVKGQSLFRVYSQDLLATQEEYLLALKDIENPMRGRFASTFNKSSEELLVSAKQRLKLWDVPSDEISRLEYSRVPSKNLIIRSPFDGIVLRQNAFVGMNVGPGIMTYTVADLSRVWVLADIYENDISFMKLGQKATLTTLALPSQSFEATITFIDYVLGASTRTAKVRFELDNTRQHFKPGMYATAEIDLKMGELLALPEEAVIDTGKRVIVFVAQGGGHFEPREVKLGVKADHFYHVLSGLSEGDIVVTSAQFLLDSESRMQSLKGGKIKGHGI